jgi:hypothetical protein
VVAEFVEDGFDQLGTAGGRADDGGSHVAQDFGGVGQIEAGGDVERQLLGIGLAGERGGVDLARQRLQIGPGQLFSVGRIFQTAAARLRSSFNKPSQGRCPERSPAFRTRRSAPPGTA